MKKIIIIVLILMINVIHADEFERKQIEKRIKPIGQVKTDQEATPAVREATPKKLAEKLEPGQKVYQQFCAVCHAQGVAGAPKFRDDKDWQARTKQKNLAQLTQSAIKGVNAMPPKGTCMNCSDDEINDAIKYMLLKDNK